MFTEPRTPTKNDQQYPIDVFKLQIFEFRSSDAHSLRWRWCFHSICPQIKYISEALTISDRFTILYNTRTLGMQELVKGREREMNVDFVSTQFLIPHSQSSSMGNTLSNIWTNRYLLDISFTKVISNLCTRRPRYFHWYCYRLRTK